MRTERKIYYYDNGNLKVWESKSLAWCFTVRINGVLHGGVGYGSQSAAVAAANQKCN